MSKRFEFTEKEGISEGIKIIVDKETGVQYLLAHWTNTFPERPKPNTVTFDRLPNTVGKRSFILPRRRSNTMNS